MKLMIINAMWGRVSIDYAYNIERIPVLNLSFVDIYELGGGGKTRK
jgi:hypothetical protein